MREGVSAHSSVGQDRPLVKREAVGSSPTRRAIFYRNQIKQYFGQF